MFYIIQLLREGGLAIFYACYVPTGPENMPFLQMPL